MTQRQSAVAAALAVTAVLMASACGSGGQDPATSLREQIKVDGSFGKVPELEIEAPLDLDETSSWVAIPGDGDKVGELSTVILQLTMANGRTGKKTISTLDEGQRPLEIKLGDEMFPSLAKALVGKAAHTRVVVASTSDDAYGSSGAPQFGMKGGDPMVMVADVLSTDPTSTLDGPTGSTLSMPTGPSSLVTPRLVEKDGEPSGFEFTTARKPRSLVVVPLREGTGSVVESPDRVAVDYLLQVWGAADPVQETYTGNSSVVSLGTATGVIPAWDQALVGRREGARLLILTPPALAYGASAQPGIPANSTLAFIVDVLGVG